MTTIAYDGKHLVTDSQATLGDMVYDDKCTKLFTNVGQLAAVAVAGDYQQCVDAVEAIQEHNLDIDGVRALDLSNVPETQLLCVTHEGDVWSVVDKGSFKINVNIAFGSGAAYAVAAMDLGFSARDAVLSAARRDIVTNDVLQIFNVEQLRKTEEEE